MYFFNLILKTEKYNMQNSNEYEEFPFNFHKLQPKWLNIYARHYLIPAEVALIPFRILILWYHICIHNKNVFYLLFIINLFLSKICLKGTSVKVQHNKHKL